MIMKKYLTISVILLAILLGCNRYDSHINEILSTAEEQMVEQPDSAFLLLEQIEVNKIQSKRTMAHYALLFTQAKDKNFIDETDASLINIALEYYKNHSDVHKRFLSYYYNGRILYNAGHYTQAMLSYTKAEELVDNIRDYYAIGLLYAQIGIINKEIFDYSKSLSAFCKAHTYYELANRIHLQYYTKINIGQIYLDNKQFDKAKPILLETMQWAYEHNEHYMCQACIELLSTLYEQIGEEEALKDLYMSPIMNLCDNKMIIYQSMAYICAYNKDVQGAKNFMQKALNESSGDNYDVSALLFKEYSINKKLGDYKRALESYEKLFYIQDTTLRKSLQHPIISAQKDYYQSQAEYNALKLRYNRKLQIIAIIASILFACLSFLYIRHKIMAKNKKICQYMEEIHDLENSLFVKETTVNNMTEQIKNLFTQQFTLIDKLSNTYYETHGAQKDKEAIYLQVKKEIGKLQSNKKSIQQLEDIVNQYKDNVMQIIRSEMQTFSDMDLRLLCFLYAGFSAKAISVFTNDSIGNIYMRKSRLKTKISQSNAKDKELLLHHLS